MSVGSGTSLWERICHDKPPEATSHVGLSIPRPASPPSPPTPKRTIISLSGLTCPSHTPEALSLICGITCCNPTAKCGNPNSQRCCSRLAEITLCGVWSARSLGACRLGVLRMLCVASSYAPYSLPILPEITGTLNSKHGILTRTPPVLCK